jgi:hypothetical protein
MRRGIQPIQKTIRACSNIHKPQVYEKTYPYYDSILFFVNIVGTNFSTSGLVCIIG